MAREIVEPTKRRAMGKARRLRIYLSCEGRCYKCGVKVPLEGTVIEHPIQLWMGGSDDDADLRLICGPCDKPKTAKDAAARAKVRSLIKKADPETRKPPRMKGRGFAAGSRKLPSRPFPKRK